MSPAIHGGQTAHVSERYAERVNPQWVRLLDLLEMNVRYERCIGAELFTSDGRCIVDFLSGYCVHNVGHNHPDVVRALQSELERCGPAMIQTHVADLAGELAVKLCERAGGRLQKAFFASSGSEGVEAAIKFARAHTRRAGVLSAEHAFHGLTCGALSLMSDEFWREGFEPLLPETRTVPFGELDALERELKSKRFAAFIVEPVQSEAGVCVPDPNYLRTAEALCRRYGTLFVLDEVQTGMYRTGTFLAAHHFGVDPDMVILAKALSGGLVPVGAVLMSDEVCDSVYSSLPRAFVHTSTFGENSLAMRAGLATLEVLEREALGQRAIDSGDYLRRQLAEALRDFEMVKEVRGLGLLIGIEFQAPKQLRLRLPYEAFRAVHGGMFGQILVMRLFRDSGILTQVCGNNFMVLKVAPPLVVEDAQMDAFVAAARNVVELAHSPGAFWSEALGLARRAFRS
ncbi:MAG TPA: aspartate aminotransferase family protein [Candidatus Dormibacteraeota bacterium]|nr:aspartate aminotransferase family protein [Candidatus Dormibacteraeota bacterium]